MARTRILKPWQMRWMLNLYPPLLFQRVRTLHVSPDFLHVRVRARRSLLTRNLNGTTFGGTLYAAADPVFPLMYWQALARRGIGLQAWLMAARLQFTRPAATHVEIDFRLGAEDLEEALAGLEERGKAVRTHRVEARDRAGETCAEIELTSYLRLLRSGERAVSGF